MMIPWTLQRYLFREMGKAFLLTALALTAVLGLGGGVMNMIKLGEITPGQMLRLLALVLPVSAALTLPIAALFSAAATYGRLSADNEFVACRSSGINLHLLFLPALLLSLFSALLTFGFGNYVIPGMIRNLNEFIGADIGSLIQRRLSQPRGISLGPGIRARADRCYVDPNQSDRAFLYGVSFVELRDNQWLRYGTAKEVDLRFERREASARISARMVGVSLYDRRDHQFIDLQEKTFPPNEVPTLVRQEIKFLTLGQLLHYLVHPQQWRQVRKELRRLRTAVGRRLIYDRIIEDWRKQGVVLLQDEKATYRIRCDRPARVPRDGGIELPHAVVEADVAGERPVYRADRVLLEVAHGASLEQGGVLIQAFDVTGNDAGRTSRRARKTLGPVAVPPGLLRRLENESPTALLARTKDAEPEGPVFEQRSRVQQAIASTTRDIVSTIHQRVAFSVSVFVLVILGAVLGIILRGSHVLTAFGISFVPSLLVIVTIIMGKQMARNEGTQAMGLLLLWSGITLVAVVDGWLLTRVLRR